MDEYADFGPITLIALAEELGVEQAMVSIAASQYATGHGERLTFADVDAGLPYEKLTGNAAQFVRDHVHQS